MKKLISLLLLLALACALPCALAEAKLTLPDPITFTGGALAYDEAYDGEYARERWYTVDGDIAAQVLAPYIDYLKTIPTLEYGGMVEIPAEGYTAVHHYFVPKNATYNCFSYEGVTDSACLDLYYACNGGDATYYLAFYLSTDFSFEAPNDEIAAMVTRTERAMRRLASFSSMRCGESAPVSFPPWPASMTTVISPRSRPAGCSLAASPA